MKKVLCLVLTAMLLLAASAASAATQLEMLCWMSEQQEGIDAMVDAFNASQKDIEVTVSYMSKSAYFEKLNIGLPAGSAPDIIALNVPSDIDYSKRGFLLDISDLFESGAIDLSRYPEHTIAAHTIDGVLHGVPRDYDSIAVYYNKALFDAAGVAYPNDDWTIDDFVETAKALTTDKTVGWSNTTSDRVYYNFMVSNGGKIYSDDGTEALVNSPECVEVVQKLMDLFNGGYAYNGSQLAEVNASAAFTSGLAAMDIDGSWMISQFADALGDNLGICQLPSGPAGKGSAGHGIGYATTTSNPHMEETLKFLAYLATDEAQEMQANVVIPAANAAAVKWEEVYPNVNVNAFVQALGYSFPVPLAATNATVTRSTFQEYLGNMLQGQYATAQEALDAAKEAMDFAIEE